MIDCPVFTVGADDQSIGKGYSNDRQGGLMSTKTRSVPNGKKSSPSSTKRAPKKQDKARAPVSKPTGDKRFAGGTWIPLHGSLLGESSETSLNPTQASRDLILCLRSRPTDVRTSPGFDREVDEVQSALSGVYQFEPIDSVPPCDVRRHIAERLPRIVHFSGHGDPRGLLLEQRGDRTAVLVPNSALHEMFTLLSPKSIRVVVLNSCYSEAAARLIARHLDYSIGMAGAIENSSAAIFASAFYRALFEGETVRASFLAGCKGIETMSGAEAIKPRLFCRPELDSHLTLNMISSTGS